MNNLKKFNDYINEEVETVRDLSDLRNIEQWLKSIWSKIENLDEVTYTKIFNEIEDRFGETVTEIIERGYSADKLHYKQTGSTVATGGIDTGDFIEDFENIKAGVDSIISKYVVSEAKTFEKYSNDELADWQQRWDQLMMDMEESEQEGGAIADDYSKRIQELETEKEVNEKKLNYLRQHLNDRQAENIIGWLEAGKDKEFIKVKLEFYGISPEEIDKMIKLLYEKDYLEVNRMISQYDEGKFESIKRFADFEMISEKSNIEELLANTKNMWIVFVGDEPIGGTEYLHDAFHDILMTRVADTEEEEYVFHDAVKNILSELGSDYDEVDQDELNDKIDEMMNEMGKNPIYRIKKRNSITKQLK